MDFSKNLKDLREKRGLLQKQVASAINVYPSNYSKIEKGERQPTVEMLIALAELFGVSIDELVNSKGIEVTQDESVEDKDLIQQVKLIQQLEERDKQAVFRIVDTMLTNKKLKDFVHQNMAI